MYSRNRNHEGTVMYLILIESLFIFFIKKKVEIALLPYSIHAFP